ncbi:MULTISPECIES: hypothetical protein [Paracoccus]|uniref:hypothetical protein n=1 Tax=Paracoccus TaxID=265 RepID=UPI0002F9D6B7|nr:MULTISPECIES: hypothetical protein [Paracoccus]MBB4625412.1 hypothetical protein [Paracoccus denitrificans]MCU7428238.1 hypothetical protein [Paracoccus denitrificans]MDK8875381.1 hypothetical protein [Paracoccus sp. SSJ]UFS64251.1 hypothetical protein LO749_08725 [Paracoccus denitrificans]UPV95866.1 hypothetical protein M0K93_04560 [Paracoccus denitrificans]
MLSIIRAEPRKLSAALAEKTCGSAGGRPFRLNERNGVRMAIPGCFSMLRKGAMERP